MCKRTILTLAFVVCLAVGFSVFAQEKPAKKAKDSAQTKPAKKAAKTGQRMDSKKTQQTATDAEGLAWRVGVQCWSFNKFTFFESVDKAASMGMKVIEAFPGQKISADGDAVMDPKMDDATRQKVRDKLKAAGIQMVAFGVVGGGSEAEWREIFQFAKSMGVEVLTSEPAEDQMAMLDKLCAEFKIAIAIHNHPKQFGAHYWNPDTVLKAVEGRSKWIGACADTGHWARSGLVPLECVKKLKGRITHFHLKDLNVASPDGHDVPWGSGMCDIGGILAELKQQGYKGAFCAEYEYNWDNSVPEITQCADYFRTVAAALADGGYEPLLKNDLSNTVMEEGGWVFENGVLTPKGKGEIWTKENYGDFALQLDFKCEAETNSGVFLRCSSIENWLDSCIEVQILQPWLADALRENCGGIFDCLAPSKKMVKEAGEWNHYLIIAKANWIYVILNGEQITAMNLDLWTEAHKNPDGTPNKFANAYKDMARAGCIGLQYHGHPIWFRDLKIKKL
jgi:sugar phosphate isomerase/epimerase